MQMQERRLDNFAQIFQNGKDRFWTREERISEQTKQLCKTESLQTHESQPQASLPSACPAILPAVPAASPPAPPSLF